MIGSILNRSSVTLELRDSVAIVMGIVIGVGIFKTPSEVAQYLPSPFWALAAWFAGGVIALMGALCYGELAASFPRTGGNYIYLKESYGTLVAFLYAWIELAIIRPGSIAAISFILAEAFISFFSLSPPMTKPAAIMLILLLSWINLLGLRYSKDVQNALVASILFLLAGTFLMSTFSQKGNFDNFDSSHLTLNAGFLGQFGLALIPILWTYGGWHENTFLSGETRNPSRSIPLALLIAIALIILLYVTANFVYLYLMPLDQIAASQLVMSDAMKILLGRYGQKLVEVFIILASLGGINGILMTGSRMAYALAADYLEEGERNLKALSPKMLNGSIYLMTALSILMVIFLGTFGRLLFFTGIVVWLSFALVAGGLLILRQKYPNLPRPYRVLFYPVTPLLFLLICLALFFNTLLTYPLQSVVGLSMILLGLPVYAIFKKIRGSV